MKHGRPPIPAIVLIVLALVAATWYLVSQKSAGDGALTASGTIEAVQVHISPELAGRVAEVYVSDGQVVQAGDPLFRLDGALLTAQRDVASAAVSTANAAVQTALAAEAAAQSQYDLALATAQAESAAARAQTWRTTTPGIFDQPGWYFTQVEQIRAAEAELAAAENRVAELSAALDALIQAEGVDFITAATNLAGARTTLQVAGDVLARARLSGNADLIDAAQFEYDSAEDGLNAAQDAYDNLLSPVGAQQEGYSNLLGADAAQRFLEARAALIVAEARVQSARDRMLALQTGEWSLRVAAAARGVDQARAAGAQAVLAEAQAKAALALIDTQITKLTVYAPIEALVLTRAIQPGEVVQPGASAVSLIQLSDLTITVYVPEDRYGELRLGQSATLTADSFPGETFRAAVVNIAAQAEFTPRNVQTVEGRSSTVYAIKLSIQDPDGKLKAGMPADVVFERSNE